MKMYLYATRLDDFLKGDYVFSLKISSRDDLSGDGWHLLQEIDVDIESADRAEVTKAAVVAIDDKIQTTKDEFSQAICILEAKKQEFLALPSIGVKS